MKTMKKINKMIIGVVGGISLLASKDQVVSAAITTTNVNTVQRYSTATPTPTTIINYRDANIRLNVVTILPTAKPTATPTLMPSTKPTATPIIILSSKPTASPTAKPSPKPSPKLSPKPSPKLSPKPTPKSAPKGSGASGIVDIVKNFFSSLFGK